MTEQRIIHSDINTEFDELVSMNNLISNRHAVQIAQSYIDQYYNDLANKDPQLSPILLVGNSGMSTFARACSNTFGNLIFKHSHGSFFNSGIQDLNNFYYNSDYGMTFYISSIDKFDLMAQHKLWRILSTKRVHTFDCENKMGIDSPLWNALHVFSATNIDKLTEPLLDQFPVIIYIGNLSRDEIFLALKQRLNLLCLSVESDSVLMSIAVIVNGDVGKAIEILAMSYRVMRSKNENIITTKIMNRAFCLMDENSKTAAKNQLK